MKRKVLSPDKRRAQIVETARLLFSSKGVKETKVSDIVAAIGIAQGTFYWYFKSKDDVINAIVEEISDDFCADIISTISKKDLGAIEAFIKLFDLIQKYFYKDKQLLAIFHHEDHQYANEQLTKESIKRLSPSLEELVQKGIEEGVFNVSNTKHAVMFITAILKNFGYAELIDLDNFEWISASAMKFILKGLGYTGDISIQ